MGINQYIKIGSRIKEFRINKGLKQNEMAKLLNISVSTYSNYENNYREPKLDLIHKICDILNITLDELLDRHNLDPEISDKISFELLSPDINIVKKRLYNAFYKYLYTNEDISQHDQDFFQKSMNSQKFKMLLLQEELIEYYNLLNNKGKKKADEQIDRTIEQIVMLSKIPEYRKEDSPDQDQE